MNPEKKIPRRQEILQTIVSQLEQNPGMPIRTAALAKAIGISEAALYRHFSSKAKMFEALLQFTEETIFSRIDHIQNEQASVFIRCEATTHLLLTFADRNPGIIGILTGSAVMGEDKALRIQVTSFFDRLEARIKQFLDEGVTRREINSTHNISVLANFITAYILGRMMQFHQSEYQNSPLLHSEEQWKFIVETLKK